MTLVTTGSCSITAYQFGDNTWGLAPAVTRTFSVALPPQTITFAPLSDTVFVSEPRFLSATASSGLAVSFLSTTQTVCVVGSTGTLALVSTGTCSITAFQTGNSNYAPATAVTRSFAVTQAPQSIAFATLYDLALADGSGPLAATASSGLAVSFASSTQSVCSVSGTTVLLVSQGTCSITASQAGDARFAAATPAVRTFQVVAGKVQTISFGALRNVTLGSGPVALSITVSSGLAVSLTTAAPAVCTVAGFSVTLVSVGTCSITASQAGDGTYAPAVPVTQSFRIVPDGVNAQSYLISTVAGNENSGYSGDGALATASSLSSPRAVVIGPGGDMHIADSSNFRLRKVAAPTGIISTEAGTGTSGVTGDGGPATAATFGNLSGLALTEAGDMFLMDSTQARVRRINAVSGTIGTVAGGGTSSTAEGIPATSAIISVPGAGGVTVDSAGNLYLLESVRVRKVAAATGLITTVAGNGTSGFSGDGGPATSAQIRTGAGIAVDAQGNLYIADNGNHRIRKVSAVTGIITTVAGNGFGGFSGDGGAATSATLFTPNGVAVDALGNLYIADTNNHRIRKVSGATGSITTIAGNGRGAFGGDGGTATAGSLWSPFGVAVDPAGNVYVADSNNHRIRMLTPIVGSTPQVITFNQPASVSFSAGSVQLSGASSSGLAVAWTSGTPSVCVANGAAVTLVAAGSCAVTASQAGNATYAPAAPVTRTFTIAQAAQSISFGAIPSTAFGSGPVSLSAASATSGLPVTFSSSTTAICSVAPGVVNLLGVGTCTIVARQAGNANYLAAAPVTQSFTVTAPANAVTLTLGNASASAGQTVELPLQITANGTVPSGFQLDLSFDPAKLSFVSARIGAAGSAAGKSVSSATPQSGLARVLVTGVNQTGIANGVAAYASFKLAQEFVSGAAAIATSNCTAVDALGFALATPCIAGTVKAPGCDINSDGSLTVSDVQLIINEVLGVSPAVHDLNGDGQTNVVDVQLVVNAVLGLGCATP